MREFSQYRALFDGVKQHRVRQRGHNLDLHIQPCIGISLVWGFGLLHHTWYTGGE